MSDADPRAQALHAPAVDGVAPGDTTTGPIARGRRSGAPGPDWPATRGGAKGTNGRVRKVPLKPFSPGALHPDGFGVVPVALMRRAEATAAHIAVYAAIASCADTRDGVAEARLRRLVDRSRCSRRTVQRKLKDLMEWGFVAVVERPGQSNSLILQPTRVTVTPVPLGHPSPRQAEPGGGSPEAGSPVAGDTPPQTRIQTQSQRGALASPPGVAARAPGPVNGDGVTAHGSSPGSNDHAAPEIRVEDFPPVVQAALSRWAEAKGTELAAWELREFNHRLSGATPEKVAAQIEYSASLLPLLAGRGGGDLTRP